MTLPAIISASRRTDIPAFFPDWFADCVSRGIAAYRNPYSGKPAETRLDRDSVAAFVFWTRNPRPFFPVLSRLERQGYRSIFHFTVTGMSRELERSAPAVADAVEAFRELSERIGPRRVLWRFDPILPGEDTAALVGRFDALSASLAGLSTRCTLSLAHPYRKSVRAMRSLPGIWEPSPDLRRAAETIRAIGRSRGFDVVSCCSPLLREWGIPAGACMDAELIASLYPEAEIPRSLSPSREGCLCAASRDIGTYGTCRHGCLYCYAA